MKRILIPFNVLLLISIVCLSGQATKSVKGIPLANATYKTSLVNDVKGSVEEVPLAILGSDTRATIIITKYEQSYPLLLWSSKPLSSLYARPPPE